MGFSIDYNFQWQNKILRETYKSFFQSKSIASAPLSFQSKHWMYMLLWSLVMDIIGFEKQNWELTCKEQLSFAMSMLLLLK